MSGDVHKKLGGLGMLRDQNFNENLKQLVSVIVIDLRMVKSAVWVTTTDLCPHMTIVDIAKTHHNHEKFNPDCGEK